MLAGNFNFGGLNPIYDPATTVQGADGTWSRTPFPNNQVPQARFDPAVKNFLARNPYVPENNTQRAFNAALGPTNNLVSPTNYRSYRTRFDVKLDQQFSSAHKMFGRYSHVRHRSWRDRLSPEIAWKEYDWRAVPIPIDQRNVVISDTYTISPSLINEARLGFNRRKGTVFPSTIGGDWAKQLGIPNVNAETFPNFQACNNQSNCTGGTNVFPSGQQRSIEVAGSRRGHHIPEQRYESDQPAHIEVRLRDDPHAIQFTRRGAAFGFVPVWRHGFSVLPNTEASRHSCWVGEQRRIHAGGHDVVAALVFACLVCAG